MKSAALILLSVLCLAYAQQYTWASLGLYHDQGCLDIPTLIVYQLNLCWRSNYNESYPYTFAQCSGSKFILQECSDSKCSHCFADTAVQTGVCQADNDDDDDDTYQLAECYTEEPMYSVYLTQQLFFNNPTCSGTPAAAGYSTLQVGCFSGGLNVQCPNGGLKIELCSAPGCSECNLINEIPPGCVGNSTTGTSEYYKCYQ